MSIKFRVLFVNSLLSDKFNLSFENMVLHRESSSFQSLPGLLSLSYKVRTDAELALNKNISEKVSELSSKKQCTRTFESNTRSSEN